MPKETHVMGPWHGQNGVKPYGTRAKKDIVQQSSVVKDVDRQGLRLPF